MTSAHWLGGDETPGRESAKTQPDPGSTTD